MQQTVDAKEVTDVSVETIAVSGLFYFFYVAVTVLVQAADEADAATIVVSGLSSCCSAVVA